MNKSILLALSLAAGLHAEDDPLTAWSHEVRIAPVSPLADRATGKQIIAEVKS